MQPAEEKRKRKKPLPGADIRNVGAPNAVAGIWSV